MARLTKSQCRSPRARPTRTPVSASNASKNLSLARTGAASTCTICSALSVRGAR
ncbi:MAG TPA: hypothetical protein VE623_06450 [Acidimicrobiales bacterium]|nr:hypothetical protein [Acidimicrobiales bacterium]